MKYLIGIDIGTTGAKSVLINERGKLLASDFQDYPLSLPHPGWAEQNPEHWVAATVLSLRNLISSSGVAPKSIAGLSFSGQMHGLVCMDELGHVLRPAILWCDQRTSVQCRAIEQAVGGRARLIQLVGNPALEGFTLPKLLWVKQIEPQVYEQTRTILLPKDYVRYRLTGNLGMDVSDAAGTLMLDVKNKRWSKELLQALDIPMALLPPLGESPDIAGTITQQASEQTGLPVGLPVAFGGADNTCAAVGNGVIEQGTVAVSIGTSGTVIAPTNSPVHDKEGRVHTFNHSVPGTWYVMGVMQAAGLSLKWLRDNFGGLERAMGAELGIDPYEFLTAHVGDIAPGAEGLLWLPYLNGERTPHLDPNARGVLFGLSARHTKYHVVRAILEGVVFGLRDSLEIIRSLKIPVEQIRLTGGGAKSPIWRQIQADVFEHPVVTLNVEEGPAFGAAVIAGVATGVLPGFKQFSDRFFKVSREIQPIAHNTKVYEKYYQLYRKLYADLKGDFNELAGLAAE